MSAIPTGAVIADKGYDSNALIEAVEASGAQAIIPPRSNRTTQRKTDWHRYKARNLIEIVFTQMTKAGVLAGGAGGDNVADFDLVVGDHDPIDQQFDQRAFLRERGVGQAGADPLAKRGDRSGQSGQFGVVIDLGCLLYTSRCV